ncbi:DUF1992 domain-containing protein [Actinoplanes sp. NPDC051861]|uniref:DnaJ family domain-containing protein n=1 Tax=Actinoplanes sp. NPDC051861 TaxID=3155170 RepID=UPI0034304AB8
MVHWYESSIDRQMREATERGEFDNLAGTGKPLSGYGEEYDEDWWVKDWLRREGGAAGVIPASLALRRAVEDLPGDFSTEQALRDHVADLNERIDRARRGLISGPPVVLAPLDVERIVADWSRCCDRRRCSHGQSSDRWVSSEG